GSILDKDITIGFFKYVIHNSVYIIAELMIVIGVWKVTRSEPSNTNKKYYRIICWLARLFIITYFIFSCMYLVTYYKWQSFNTQINKLSYIFAIASFCCLVHYLIFLAKRIPDLRLIKYAYIVISGLLLCLLFEYIGSSYVFELIEPTTPTTVQGISMAILLMGHFCVIVISIIVFIVLLFILLFRYRNHFNEAARQAAKNQGAGD
ncbi:MAG: hypothetical protein ACYTF1_12595, partial [Planctomycetota bacterium]